MPQMPGLLCHYKDRLPLLKMLENKNGQFVLGNGTNSRKNDQDRNIYTKEKEEKNQMR